jgi:hypothetical protein
LFGPTYPGTFDSSKQVSITHGSTDFEFISSQIYFLEYPGARFQFPIPKEYEGLYKNKDKLPIEFPVSYFSSELKKF